MDLLEKAKENTRQKQKEEASTLIKLLSLFSVVRGINILIIVIAQYLAAIFIFAPKQGLKHIVLDVELYFIVVASACVIASGYIINNFYDVKKDLINRPQKYRLDNIVSQKLKLQLYFILNFLGVIFGFFVSWRAALFFSTYIFLIWFYSHKLRQHPLLGLFSAVTLSILPFFAVFVYYKNFSTIIFTHASFLFFILIIRVLIKDLESIKGDIVQNYVTIPIKYGERFTKILISIIALMTLDPIYFLWKYPEIGAMKYYFYFAVPILGLFTVKLWINQSNKNYIQLHILLKILIVLGVFSLALIDTSVIIKRLMSI
ncbi:MAG: geranylgeranylglycerol-phosphate geranylgeranyltransferase [Flavobacteriaceae bacterium]|nr:geranylgeranylglycerol-phosphate geranylgeranyltransferase [Flavobacteriaceae bacterium]